MANYILGVKTVKYGTPTVDGGMATLLDNQVAPYKEPVTFENEEGEVVKHFSEGARYPLDNDSLKEWMGGEIVNGQWQAPRGNFQAAKSLELMTEFGIPVSIPKATCYGVRRFGQKTTDISLIEISAIVELPEKADLSPMTIGVVEA